MALRQIFVVGGIRNLGKSYSNLNFVKRQQPTTNPIRFLRNRSSQEGKQNFRLNSTTPFEGFVQPHEINPNVLRKSLMFTAAFTAGTFVSVTIWEYEKIRGRAINVMRNSNPLLWFKKTPRQELIQSELQLELDRIKGEIDVIWNKFTPGEKIFAPVFVLNVIVYGLWRVPALKPFMLRYFCSNPGAKAVCWPMFLSTFSHYSLFHLFANMYVLHSFSAAANTLGREQFLGLYLSAGVIASFTSYLFKVAVAAPGYSLGASGAIMAILAYVCNHYPETKLSILFLPQLQFSAGNAIQVIMAFDVAGIIFRWRLFDHAAHLGGACMGLFWSYYGQDHLWPLREHIVGFWHQVRGKPQK